MVPSVEKAAEKDAAAQPSAEAAEGAKASSAGAIGTKRTKAKRPDPNDLERKAGEPSDDELLLEFQPVWDFQSNSFLMGEPSVQADELQGSAPEF